jgi:SAM-dependent methyltransferase
MRALVRREDWDRRYSQPDLLWSATPNRFLVREVAELPPGRALDLACGEGRNALWLAGRGWTVTGVDCSAVAIEKARRRSHDEGAEVDFVCADLLDYEPSASAYDLVLVLYLQLPFPERRLVLSRGARAVATGGTFLLVGHDLANMTDGVGGPTDADVLYTPDDIVAEVPGLVIEKAERVLRDVPDEERPAIDALVRAHRPGPG